MDDSISSKLSRRRFLALLSASAAFTAASCSNYKDRGEILPYVNKPEEIVPGIANFYASVCSGCSQGCGTIIKTREGRPIKVDGNPEHPVNRGKICATGQASVYNMYDPVRLKGPLNTTWQQLDSKISSEIKNAASAGKEIAIVAHPVNSPTEAKLIAEFLTAYPSARVYYYDHYEKGYRRNAWKKSFGADELPYLRFDKARVILALESDFLSGEHGSVRNARLFARSRDVMNKKDSSRLYSISSTLNVTAMAADYRMYMRPDAQTEFLRLLTEEVGAQRNAGGAVKGAKVRAITSAGLKSFAAAHKLNERRLSRLAFDLAANPGTAVIVAGDAMPEDVHVAVNNLNEIIGANALYSADLPSITHSGISQKEDFERLTDSMRDGRVAVLIHYDTNPVYHFPGDSTYISAMKKVPVRVSMTEIENETSRLCNYIIPLSHGFESWGDVNAYRDLYSLRQPVIAPVFNTRQKEEVLLSWLRGGEFKENAYYEYLRGNWKNTLFPDQKDFDTFWNRTLHDGIAVKGALAPVVAASNTKVDVQTGIPVESELEPFRPAALSFNRTALQQTAAADSAALQGYCLYVKRNYFLGDGRFANNGWLQELPHPVSKIVWDNYAAVSDNTARELGVENGSLIEITSGKRRQTFPVFIQPGTADKVIVVESGYGRWQTGDVGLKVGVNTNILLKKDAQYADRILNQISVRKAPGSYELVATQEQHSLDDEFLKDIHLKRDIIREGTLSEYQRDEHFLPKDERKPQSVNEDVKYTEVKWGMGIDLNKCLSCGACIMACDVENNIPVVGKEEVKNGREMHWFRVDRYYSGTTEDPDVSLQPMLCQHCDTAPCENVCPVQATMHSYDGLNQMAYNRCVGTRYCSNNCPYKVRRFNFFNFRDHFADGYYEDELMELGRNPEVTVRSRGVMEKCTFCIQRIMQAREDAREEGRTIRGTDVQTACQQACPSNAIVFGDMNDKNSDVVRYHSHPLGYYVLSDLNTRPNISYIARLRNIEEEDKIQTDKHV